jgi:hypothetical protein
MENNLVVSLEEATTKADYYANIACRAILTALETDTDLDKYSRKIVLDAINDFKRNVVRYIYKAV